MNEIKKVGEEEGMKYRESGKKIEWTESGKKNEGNEESRWRRIN